MPKLHLGGGRALSLALLGVMVLCGCLFTQAARSTTTQLGASATGKALIPVATPDCGPAAPAVLANAAGEVATRIYAAELASSETSSDQHQVEGDSALLDAIASGSPSEIEAAVTALVYSHTHIVRLRITRGSTVLADVGGPYILAPVGGPLRLHGRTIAHYVLSVQDDLGYVKLVTRFLDLPLAMRVGSHQLPVEGLLSPGPPNIPALGALTYRGVRYEAVSFNVRSFPGGSLRVSLFVALPSGLSAKSCSEIKSAELGHAAQLISERFSLTPKALPGYIRLVRTLTHGLLYIRSGAKLLGGSPGRGPAKLPNGGTVKYRRRSYEVYSFLAPSSVGELRVYQLTTP